MLRSVNATEEAARYPSYCHTQESLAALIADSKAVTVAFCARRIRKRDLLQLLFRWKRHGGFGQHSIDRQK
jgi:hypothetical protein